MSDSVRRLKADIFQALGHPTRIAILEILERGELSAGTLIRELGLNQTSISQANISQHLTVLRAQQIVLNRKVGNQVFYSVRDPIILKVLALMRHYLQGHLRETKELLNEMEEQLPETSPPLPETKQEPVH